MLLFILLGALAWISMLLFIPLDAVAWITMLLFIPLDALAWITMLLFAPLGALAWITMLLFIPHSSRRIGLDHHATVNSSRRLDLDHLVTFHSSRRLFSTVGSLDRITMLFRRLGLVDRVVEGVEAAGLKCTVYDQEIFIAQRKFINAKCLEFTISKFFIILWKCSLMLNGLELSSKSTL